MHKVLITGGAGFIGSSFVRLLLDEVPACKVVNFDNLTYAGNLDNLAGLDDAHHRFVRGDIANRDEVLAALELETDAVINFAAESHVDRSIASADEFIRTNVLGTQVLLDAARERRVKRFVQISTDEVMGSLSEDENGFFTEESPFAPNSPYAASKAAAEHLVRAAHHTFGLDVVITRCGNNYGPRQFPEKFLPLIVANAMNDEPIPVYGDGLNIRDWIYVDDHCRAILAILEKGKAGGAKPSNGTAQILSGLTAPAAGPIAISMPSNTGLRSARNESNDHRRRRFGGAGNDPVLLDSGRSSHCVGSSRPRYLE